MTTTTTLFENGTEKVIQIEQDLYVSGIGYEFFVTVNRDDQYYMVSGGIRKETHAFLKQHLGLPHIV